MPKLPEEAVLAERKLVIQAHLEAECITHDVDATVATFGRPHLEIPALATDAEGQDAVHRAVAGVLEAFPDFYIRPVAYYDAETAVIVEAVLGGTQTGTWAGRPPSGKPIAVESVIIFEFEGVELVSEKVFFDHATLLRQISSGN